MAHAAHARISGAANLVGVSFVTLITGLVAFGFVFAAFTCILYALLALLLSVYLIVFKSGLLGIFSMVSAVMLILCFYIFRWIARGVLQRKSVQSAIAGALVLLFALTLTASFLFGDVEDFGAGTIAQNISFSVECIFVSIVVFFAIIQRTYRKNL